MKKKSPTTALLVGVKLSDEEFIKLYLKHNKNQSETGRFLGISQAAVGKRAKKLKTQIDAKIAHKSASKDAGKAAAAVMQAIPADKKSFQEGVQEVTRKFQASDQLDDMFTDIADLLGCVKEQIEETKEKKKSIKPFHIDQVIKLVNQQRQLVIEAHKIRLDLLNTKAIEAYIGAVNRIICRQEPNVQLQLYNELANIGIEGQTLILAS